jgi:enterochelin esterase-like enzyme
MEYLLELRHAAGSSELTIDPGNERTSPGAFGAKSEIVLDDYEPPDWLEEDVQPGRERRLEVRCRPLRARLPVQLWAPPDSGDDDRLPLLIANDGPELAQYSLFTRFLEVMTAQGRVPSLRAALIGPVDRDQSYSASAAYTRSFAHEILPELLQHAPTPHGRATRLGMGLSLGAVAMLHAHRRVPAALGGLFLMSGSYFRKRFDPQEANFVRFRRISRFVGEILAAESWSHPIPVSMTCGGIEENLANNKALRSALLNQEYRVHFHENRDGHNWTAWRDLLDPHLVDLIAEVWG